MKDLKEFKLYIQGKEHIVDIDNVSPTTSLNSYIRNTLQLTGTKGMCYQGGCGACVVVLHQQDANTGNDTFISVNSCLVPVLSCKGWNIWTIEGIGNPLIGYHPVQEVLAKFNGTQCGFCSSGMVMNMYALYESGNLTMEKVENSFSGNICRCTGYRSILSAFKSLAPDASTDILGQYPDIENLQFCKKDKCLKKCQTTCSTSKSTKESFCHMFADATWIKVYTLQSLLNTLKTYASSTYKLVAGSTAKGVFSSYGSAVDIYIDVTSVLELKISEVKNDKYILGANATLTTSIKLLKQIAEENSQQFAYLNNIGNHLDSIANFPVRNLGTLAGNLIMKHDNPDFPSDLFVLLETTACTLNVVSTDGASVNLTPQDFLKYDMNFKVLQSIEFPSYSDLFKFVSYRISPKAQNAHPHVNAGFMFKFNEALDTVESASIVYGNINPLFVHATQSEALLVGKNLFDSKTIQTICASLDREIICSVIPPEASPDFRKKVAIALFYKAVLSIAPAAQVAPKYQSGGALLARGISTGAQDYETKKSLYPVTEPVVKLEALNQTTGQAQYINDIPDLPHQLQGSLIFAQAPPSSIILSIDATAALAIEGIKGFFTKDDIPGDNTFTPPELGGFYSPEEIFCKGTVLYYNQPIGILVGASRAVVTSAASLIKISYSFPTEAPLLSIRQILKTGHLERVQLLKAIKPLKKGTDIKYVVKGTFDIYYQYHLHMETQNCNVVPTEDGLEINPGSQWIDQIQLAVSKMLNIQQNKILCKVRRLGGAFGAKISRNGLISCATALAAWKLQKPVKASLSLKENLSSVGKRFPLSVDYEVGVNNAGIIQYLNADLYTDVGSINNENPSAGILPVFMGSYMSDVYSVKISEAVTDTPPNTWTRAPGSCEGLGSIEAIMEHVATEINMDPFEFRLANLINDSPLVSYFNEMKTWANIVERKQEINEFNQSNRWKKKGLSIVPMTWFLELGGPFSAMVSIYHGDGSVQLSHGGIEMGQGINTKAAQVCAYKLGIELEKVSVIPSNSFVSPNNTTSGGSVTSEAVCHGVIQACDILNKRIQPYKDLNPEASWEDIIKLCFQSFVNLSASAVTMPNDASMHNYKIYGMAATEVLVDVLTGQHLITRVDLIEDTGDSLSPLIDIGQVEGAFVMGMGYYMSERIEFNYEGRVLTNDTWTYYPPGAKDIPIDFRIKFPKDNPNPIGVLNSKATAEPPLCMAISVPLAIRNAVASARTNSDASNSKWYPIDGVTNVEDIFTNCLNDYKQYVL